jgi:coenzyme F420-reducing hydrogenase alpha subunit
MTPTAQNIANIEDDMRLVAQKLIDAGAEAAEIQLEIEKLVRAYDPCLSCSVH